MVTEQFEVDWTTVLVSTFNTIVMRIDGRGSGFKGTNLLHQVQKKLGEFEERDQLEALRSDHRVRQQAPHYALILRNQRK